MCQLLYCRRNSTVSTCEAFIGAADGTLCDSGKVCLNGICTPSLSAQTGTCLYGDGLIVQEITGITLTSPQMKCTNFFDLISNSGLSISGFCADSRIGDICCQSCKSKYS